MPAITPPTPRPPAPQRGALLLALAVFVLLWLVGIRYRLMYQPNHDDLTNLADGLLLLPGARWEDWFTTGYSRFFEPYPEWPSHMTAFSRPVFQAVIYVAHFVLGVDWPSYLAINYLATAGVTAAAFVISRAALGLGNGAALIASTLVLVSPPVAPYAIWGVGYGSEFLASLLVGFSFVALLARRDFLCFVLLLLALLSKETALWAPLAAVATVILQDDRGGPLRRASAAALVALPIAIWLGLRVAFFGGVGGTYATLNYAQPTEFLSLLGWKVAHLHELFVDQDPLLKSGLGRTADRIVGIATALLIWLLLALWSVRTLRATSDRLLPLMRVGQPPMPNAALLTSLWVGAALAFQLALALPFPRYAPAAVMFAWPALMGEVANRRVAWLRIGLAACFVLSVARTSYFLAEWTLPSERSYSATYFRDIAHMNAALREVPGGTRQVYVVSAESLMSVHPDYLRAFLHLPFEIVRLTDVAWNCEGRAERIAFDHDTAVDEVILSAAVPDCASFQFLLARIDADALRGGRIRRSDTISYDLPEAHPTVSGPWWRPPLAIGRRMIVHIRTRGPARFIIDHGGSDGFAWFDVP